MSITRLPIELWFEVFEKLVSYTAPTLYENWVTKRCADCGSDETRLWLMPGSHNFNPVCQTLERNRDVSRIRPLAVSNATARAAIIAFLRQQHKHARRDFFVTTSWFEDAVRLIHHLTGQGLQNITSLQLEWDNVVATNRQHLHNRWTFSDEAAGEMFDRIEQLCINLEHFIISIDARNLVTKHADGRQRSTPLKLFDIPGLENLARLLQKLWSLNRKVDLKVLNDEIGLEGYLRAHYKNRRRMSV